MFKMSPLLWILKTIQKYLMTGEHNGLTKFLKREKSFIHRPLSRNLETHPHIHHDEKLHGTKLKQGLKEAQLLNIRPPPTAHSPPP